MRSPASSDAGRPHLRMRSPLQSTNNNDQMVLARSAKEKQMKNGATNPTVVRTERGLTVDGTRLTLYSIMDYIKEDWPPKLIRDFFDLTDRQINDVMAYIEEHRE